MLCNLIMLFLVFLFELLLDYYNSDFPIENQESGFNSRIQVTAPGIMHQFKVYCSAPGGEHVLTKRPEGSGRP